MWWERGTAFLRRLLSCLFQQHRLLPARDAVLPELLQRLPVRMMDGSQGRMPEGEPQYLV